MAGIFVTVALLLGSINTIGILVVTIVPQWRINSIENSQPSMMNIRYAEGLWVRCTMAYQGTFSCDRYDTSIIGLEAYLNAFRAFMVIASLLSCVGVICSILGMSCITALEEESKGKRYCIIVGGFCHMLAGVLTGICVSWYAAEVVRQFYYPANQVQPLQYTFGLCLYLGWITMVVSLISGALLSCCGCCMATSPKNTSYNYAYKPTHQPEAFSAPPPQAAYRPEPREKSYHYKSDYRSSSRHDKRSHHSSQRSISSRDSDIRASGYV